MLSSIAYICVEYTIDVSAFTSLTPGSSNGQMFTRFIFLSDAYLHHCHCVAHIKFEPRTEIEFGTLVDGTRSTE